MDQEPSHRSFENRELDMSKFIDITNPEIAMSEIPTEPDHRLDPRQQTTSAKRHMAQPGSDKCQTDSTFQAHVGNESK